MTPIQAAQEILKLEKESTPGPWTPNAGEVWSSASMLTRDDAQFIAFSRNHAPLIAKSLIRAVEALKKISIPLTTSLEGNEIAVATTYIEHMGMAREALREIEGMK